MWLAGGLVLLVVEVVTPSGFFVMFFGLGALTVGPLARFGVRRRALGAVAGLHRQFGRVSAALPRPAARPRASGRGPKSTRSSASWPFRASGFSRATSGGRIARHVWTARNDAAQAIEPGQRCRVTGVDNLSLSRSTGVEGTMEGGLFVIILLAIIALIILAKTAIVVPQQSAFVVERLGRYRGPSAPGFTSWYRSWTSSATATRSRNRRSTSRRRSVSRATTCRSRRRRALSEGAQPRARLVRHLRLPVRDLPAGPDDAAQRGRQDRPRSDVRGAHQHQHRGRRELDKASEPWGVKVLRYEIKNITPPHDILAAMEKQMRAEREKRAVILTSEGQRDAAINTAEGEKQQRSRRRKPAGSSRSTRPKARPRRSSRSRGHRRRHPPGRGGDARPGGAEAIQLRVAEQYINEFGKVINNADTIILPANVADVAIDDHHRDEDRAAE